MSGTLSRGMTILTVSMPTTSGSPVSRRSTTRVERSGFTYTAHAVSTMTRRVVPGIVLTSALRGGAPATRINHLDAQPQPGPAHVRPGGGVQSSEERHAGRFLLTLGKTGTGGGDAGRRVHLVCAHCGSGMC